MGFKEAALVHLLYKVSGLVCVGYVCSECGAVPLAQVHLKGIHVDVLVWQVTPGGAEYRIDVYALGVGDKRPGPDVYEYGEHCFDRVSAVLLLFLFDVLFVDNRCDGVYACTVDGELQVEFPP